MYINQMVQQQLFKLKKKFYFGLKVVSNLKTLKYYNRICEFINK